MTWTAEQRRRAGRPERPLRVGPLVEAMVGAVESTGLTRRELARRSGLSEGTVCDMLLSRTRGSIDSWTWLLEAAGLEVVVGQARTRAEAPAAPLEERSAFAPRGWEDGVLPAPAGRSDGPQTRGDTE